jgi:adenine-specific DNA-methyltransferase
MENNDYQNWSKVELIKEIKRLKKRKKYGLVWEDKPEEVVEMCKEKLPVVKEVKNKEIITDKNKPVNLLIEGDNYHALSVLNYTHEKKIDVIYIDPPYNTGNKDFIFNDKYIDKEDSYRHSKWLSFIEKRLRLAKNLLKNTGVIFISINDNEVAQLKLLMDNTDLFRENNFIAQFIWRSKGGSGTDPNNITIETEYILCYARNREKLRLNRYRADTSNYTLTDEYVNERGRYKLNKLDRKSLGYIESLDFPIKQGNLIAVPGGKDNYKKVWRWRWSKKKVEWGLKNGFIVLKKDKSGVVNAYYKIYEFCNNEGNIINREYPFNNLIPEDLCTTSTGTNEIENIFGKRVFEYPKSVELIRYILTIAAKQDSLILDFMAGSGTTGQAVLELNKEDDSNRHFILCTNNENNNRNGYKIAEDICYPRLKKVIEGYKNLKGEWVEGLSGNLKYFKTDFVDAEPTDKNKKKLTDQAIEMLCIKEGTFEPVLDRTHFKIFKNNNHYAGIILDQLVIPEFKKAIKDINGKFSIYVFSLSDETFDEEFSDVKQKIKLSPIPEAILRVYRRIFK